MLFNYKNLAVLAIAGMGFFASCTKEKIVTKEVPVEKPAAANISITSPASTDVFSHGDTVHIKGLLTGVNTLHGYEVSIRNSDMHDEVLFLASVHNHNTVINIDTFWVNNLTTATNLSANVVATLDHEGNSIGKKVSFSVK